MRRALIATANVERDLTAVAAYLPANYRVVGATPDGILIEGEDRAGWTLDDYVLPRLASGLYHGREVTD